jgi:Cu+-exporting ATPase
MKMETQRSSATIKSKTVVDPVCGMDVIQGKTPYMSHYKGTGYYFCAEACRKTFDKNPDKYVGRSTPRRKGIWARYLDRLNKSTGGQSMSCH